MGGLFLKIRTWWETADRTQRVVTIFGSAFLAFLLFGTFYFASKPKMVLAYGGLTPSDQGRVVAEIQKLGIPVEYDLMGNVKVPSDRVAEAQAMLAKNGASPTSGHLGNADRSTIGIMSPQSVESAQLNAIREGEIAQTLESLNGVVAAKVLLSGGEKGAFASEDNPPTASVTLTEEPGADLTGAAAKAMASLVAKAVPGLTTKNVTIVNQDGISLFDGADAEGSSAAYANKVQAQVAEARRIKRELQPLLDRFGAGTTVLTVRVEMDFDKQHIIRRGTEAGATPVSKEQAEETLRGGGAIGGSGGIAGAGSNLGAPGMGDPSGDAGKNYTSKHTKAEFPQTHIESETEKAPGTVTRLAISVLANEEKIDDVAPIQEALEGYLPKEMVESGAYSVTVTPAKFDLSQEQSMEKAAASASGRERTQQILSMLPIAALVLVAFLIIKAVGKVAKSQNVMVQALPGGGTVAYAAALPAGSAGMMPAEYEGQPAGEYIPADQAPMPPRPKKKRPQGIEEEEDDEPMHVRIGRINEKVNVPLEQLKKMSRERPEAVAMLLKSWLIEEQRR